MEIIDFTLALSLNFVTLLNILIVALGLGLVIFFHELGHFLVAKWCGVYVERFSIGFGQPILSRKWGETEYALGWLPFGGYVKMLGQDDMDPGQMTDDKVAANPRSYTAKNVPQRMAIISAGVIMNVITGLLFFALAFAWGVMKVDRVVGMAQVGMPAWRSGFTAGDIITSINGRSVDDFDDVTRHTTLSRGPITIAGYHRNGETFEVKIHPETEKEGIRKIIGIIPADGLKVIEKIEGSKMPAAWPGTSAAAVSVQHGDEIIAVDGTSVKDHVELSSLFNDKRDETIALQVQRKSADGKTTEETLQLPPQSFVGLGLRMGMGRITALKDNSPATRVGLKTGDLIAKVNDLNVGADIDPFRLTETFSAAAGQEVAVTITREVEGGSPETLTLTLTPEDVDPWSEPPVMPETSLSIPSIGIAYQLVPTVFSVRENSPASGKIHPRDTVEKVTLIVNPSVPSDGGADKPIEIQIGDKKVKNWPYLMWTLQEHARTRTAQLTMKPANGAEPYTVTLQPEEVPGWMLPTTRGLNLGYLRTERKAENFTHALAMGARFTVSCIEDIYLMLRGLFTKDLSPKGLSGPIGIAQTAFTFASVGFPHFVLFLGLISINLAVINFLPIPVLDGGHMVFLLWEGIVRRKPSEKVVATATYFGLLFVLGMMIFVIYLDLTRKLQ